MFALYPVGKTIAASLSLKSATACVELVVDVERARQDGRAGGAQPVLARGLDRGFLDLVAVGDAEVVVRRQVQQLLDLARLPVADLHLGAGRGRKRLGVEVVPGGQRFLVPAAERLQQVERIVSRAVVEVAVVVLAEDGSIGVLFGGRAHFSSLPWSRLPRFALLAAGSGPKTVRRKAVSVAGHRPIWKPHLLGPARVSAPAGWAGTASRRSGGRASPA